MKRRLVLSLCAVALTAVGISPALAVVDVALNLRYNDPFDPNEGGTWSLVAKADSGAGITGLTVRISGIDPNAPATVAANIGHDINSGALKNGPFGGIIEYVYGQNPGIGSPLLVDGVGLSSFSGNVPSDVLDPSDKLGAASQWDNVTVIATGTVSTLAVRPAFTLVAANENVGGGTIDAATIGETSVRGDSWEGLGLETSPGTGLFQGDMNRDGLVGPLDLGNLGINWDPGGVANGWDDGDFNDDGAVGPNDLGNLGINWDPSGVNQVPPPIAAVPEPSSLVLLALAGVGLGWRRRNLF